MYPHTVALANRLSRPVVAFDLEHTGGPNDTRFVTDFGAMLVTPDGAVTPFSSLVKPPPEAVFNSYVSRLTGIYPATVADEPDWAHVLQAFVLPNQAALWVGFNSRTCDTPLVRRESLRHGVELVALKQLDLMRVGGLKGGLAVRLAQLRPDFDVSGAHRGLKDALMTLALLEALLPTLTDIDLGNQDVVPRVDQRRRPRPARKSDAEPRNKHGKRELDVSQFLVAEGVSRMGTRWSEEESRWLGLQFKQGRKTVEQLAALNGRTPYAVACALVKAGLLDDAAQFKKEV